jgi:hypothetical protein
VADGEIDMPLTGGRMTTGVVRRGGTVRRPRARWFAAVHELLRHLEAVDFDAAPRVVAVESDTEVLTFITGEVPADPEWQPGKLNRLPSYVLSDEALVATARLVRSLHDAVGGFEPTETGYRFHRHAPGPGEIVSHGDLVDVDDLAAAL